MATDSRVIDYATKYAKELDQVFTHVSYTDQFVTPADEFNEDGGVASVYFRTVDTSDFLQGHTGPVFSTPTTTNSNVTRKDLQFFYEINKVIPNVNLYDTAGAMAEAGNILTTGIKERFAPLVDKIRLGTAIAAANAFGGANVVTYAQASVVQNIDDAITALLQQRSDLSNMVTFIRMSEKSNIDAKLLTQFVPATNDKIIQNGLIGVLLGVKTVFVPDDLFNTITVTGTAPYATATFAADTKTKAVVWDTRVIKDARKLNKTYVMTGDQAVTAGVDGALLRGLFRPGTWVLDAAGVKKGVAIVRIVP